MARYINADTLIKELSTLYKQPTSTEDFMTDGYDKAIADVVVTAHRQPTADVRENVQGKWLARTEHCDNSTFIGHRCSVCGYWKAMGCMNYCPSCGADMREGSEDEAD